jgi:MoxR-like ATPase
MNENERPEKDVATGSADVPDWWIYRGTGQPLHDGVRLGELLPEPPQWRQFHGGPLPANDVPPDDDGESERRLGAELTSSAAMVDPREVDMVNAALYLRRPLLVTGPPGAGKSTLAFQIANELRLGRVIRWHITSNSTLKSGLYNYDAIGRAEAVATRQAELRGGTGPAEQNGDPGAHIGDYVRLGALATAFLPSRQPRVLLVDELDKSEIDLPNDLLEIFEVGSFRIPELERVAKHTPEVTVFTDDPNRRVTITGGRVTCRAFPIIVLTSNGERDFPPPFLRRCLQLEIKPPDADKLAAMVAAHLGLEGADDLRLALVQDFAARSGPAGEIPVDRLLDALYLSTSGAYDREAASWPRLKDALWRELRAV